jgi:hypothetical protein
MVRLMCMLYVRALAPDVHACMCKESATDDNIYLCVQCAYSSCYCLKTEMDMFCNTVSLVISLHYNFINGNALYDENDEGYQFHTID